MKVNTFYLGTDHGGFAVKQILQPWLAEAVLSNGGKLIDQGADQLDPDDDYPAFARSVAENISQSGEAVDQDPTAWGLLLCRTGAGMTIAANRYPGVRAVVCRSVEDARRAREHNNANVLVLEGDYVTEGGARAIIGAFLATPFGGGRHVRRLQQIEKMSPGIKA